MNLAKDTACDQLTEVRSTAKGARVTPNSRDEKSGSKPVAYGNRRPPMVMTEDGQLVSLEVSQRIELERAQVDICFVFDTTGSMSDKIEGLVNCLEDFVDELAKLSLDWRCTCLPFGDLTVFGDRVDGQLPFQSTVQAAKKQLREMDSFNGGANQGESSIEAMIAGIAKPWRPKAVRVIVLLTDDLALGAKRASDVDRSLGAENIVCFVASTPTDYYKGWALNHGGRWFEIGPYLDSRALLELLRRMARDLATVVKNVHDISGGSVRKFMQLDEATRFRSLGSAPRD